MKLSELPPPLLALLVIGVCLAAFAAGSQTGQFLFPDWTVPAAAQAAPPVAQVSIPSLIPSPDTLPDQENTLFILLGDEGNGTLSTVWHIKDMPGSPVFMDLLVPSARYGADFDQAYYELIKNLDPAAPDEEGLEALFAVHGFSWSRLVIMDLRTFVAAILEVNKSGGNSFQIDPAQVLSPLPRQNDLRTRPEIIASQVAIWNGLCPVFLSSPAVSGGSNDLFRSHPGYPVCHASDDLN